MLLDQSGSRVLEDSDGIPKIASISARRDPWRMPRRVRCDRGVQCLRRRASAATAPDRANVATSTDVERIVARVDAASVVDTTTLLGEAFSGSNARSAASVDGAAFWIGGSSGGVWFASLGGSGLTQIVDSPDNVRLVGLFGDRLFVSSGATPMTGVFAVGAGRPTSGIQSVAALDGMPRSGTSPYAFAFLDLDPTVSGLDTLYLTDDRSP